MSDITSCLITGEEIEVKSETAKTVSYILKIPDHHILLNVCRGCLKRSKEEVLSKKHIFLGHLLNGKLTDVINYETIHTNNQDGGINYFELIDNYTFPQTPSEKLDNLLIYFHSQTNVDGDVIEIEFIDTPPTKHTWIYPNYFRTISEFEFYMLTLKEKGFIDGTLTPTADGNYGQLRLTYKGLLELARLQDEGQNSNNCFIAMSFGDSDRIKGIRGAIKQACEETGHKPLLVDEHHPDSDVTINDAIIALLKKSKFTICEFTEQKDGVYFEAGYAVGRGLPVIYTCHADDFGASHFDTNHFPHIIYQDTEQLKTKLIDKIEAWIK